MERARRRRSEHRVPRPLHQRPDGQPPHRRPEVRPLHQRPDGQPPYRRPEVRPLCCGGRCEAGVPPRHSPLWAVPPPPRPDDPRHRESTRADPSGSRAVEDRLWVSPDHHPYRHPERRQHQVLWAAARVAGPARALRVAGRAARPAGWEAVPRHRHLVRSAVAAAGSLGFYPGCSLGFYPGSWQATRLVEAGS